MSTEQQIRDFVDRYYAALNEALNGEPDPMLALWSHGPEATVLHPDGGRQVGWEGVEAQWRGWSQGVSAGRIDGEEVSIRLVAPDVACVAAVERGQGTITGETIAVDARATLVLRRDGSGWQAVHHHVDVVPALRAAVERAMAAAPA
jgi:ketosteroid isomerase-like protein